MPFLQMPSSFELTSINTRCRYPIISLIILKFLNLKFKLKKKKLFKKEYKTPINNHRRTHIFLAYLWVNPSLRFINDLPYSSNDGKIEVFADVTSNHVVLNAEKGNLSFSLGELSSKPLEFLRFSGVQLDSELLWGSI